MTKYGYVALRNLMQNELDLNDLPGTGGDAFVEDTVAHWDSEVYDDAKDIHEYLCEESQDWAQDEAFIAHITEWMRKRPDMQDTYEDVEWTARQLVLERMFERLLNELPL